MSSVDKIKEDFNNSSNKVYLELEYITMHENANLNDYNSKMFIDIFSKANNEISEKFNNDNYKTNVDDLVKEIVELVKKYMIVKWSYIFISF